jgi:hypothetical protein
MPVREHAAWLTQVDERLLELLASEGTLDRTALQSRLAAVAPSVSPDDGTVDDRCAVLHDRSLVTETDAGLALTAAGKAFLDGRLDLDGDDAVDETDGVDIEDPTENYWTCPDCRWIGDHDDLATDEHGTSVCPVCGNDWEFVD